MDRIVAACILSALAAAPVAAQSKIEPITDDPRCAPIIAETHNEDELLARGCGRLWTTWPDPSKAWPDPLTREVAAQNYQRLELWLSAQILGRGHYAAMSTGPASASPLRSGDGPTGNAGDVASTIRMKCAKDWPDDFRMRVFCEDQQRTAYLRLMGRPATSSDLQIIRTKCQSDWSEDFRMRDYCEQQQIEALRKLRQ